MNAKTPGISDCDMRHTFLPNDARSATALSLRLACFVFCIHVSMIVAKADEAESVALQRPTILWSVGENFSND